MMKSKLLVSAAALALVACTAKAEPNNDKVTVEDPNLVEGAMMYILNFDTTDKMDSTVMTNGKAVFEGKIESPAFVRLESEGNRIDKFILEEGNVTINENGITGTPLNAAMNEYKEKVMELNNRFMELPQDDEAGRENIYNRFSIYRQRDERQY